MAKKEEFNSGRGAEQAEQNPHKIQKKILIEFENLGRKLQAAKGWGNGSNLNQEVSLPDGSSVVVFFIPDHKNCSEEPTPSGFISQKSKESGIESERHELGWIRDKKYKYTPYVDKITSQSNEKFDKKRLSAKDNKGLEKVLSLVQKTDIIITQSLPKRSKVDLSVSVIETIQSPKSIFSSLKGIKNAISLLK